MPRVSKIIEFTKTMMLLKERVDELQQRTASLASSTESHERRLIQIETFLQVATNGRYLPRS